MINIKELSVGNWVKFSHGIDKIIQLLHVEGKGICASYATASTTLTSVNAEYLEPVEITPEILEKNGWEVNVNNINPKKWIAVLGENAAIIRGDETFIIITTDGGEIRFPLRYVHQLQNILALCGINKEIEL